MTANWNGPAGEGAMRAHRERKRLEAEERNGRTLHERTRAHRLERCRCADFPGRKPKQRERRRATRPQTGGGVQ